MQIVLFDYGTIYEDKNGQKYVTLTRGHKIVDCI
jgi:hypothetical protein